MQIFNGLDGRILKGYQLDLSRGIRLKFDLFYNFNLNVYLFCY